MKKITFLMMTLMAFVSYGQVSIGSSDDGTAFNSSPINPYYGWSYSQTIYLASEINASGDITSLEYQLNTGTDISSCDETVDVWIGHTTNASFASTADWADVSTLTQVLTSGTITAAGDVATITFSAPFTYNGTDNLLIAVDANEAGFGVIGDVFSQTTGPADTSLHFRSDTVNPDPVTATPAGMLASVRGNVIMNGITAVCFPAVATASIVEDCGNAQFSILVDVTDLGDSVNLEITNDAGVASTTVTATGEVTVGPFPIETPVVLTLENENDDLCDVALGAISDMCPVDSNTLDFYNLQFPATLTFPENEMTDQLVYAQAYEAGLTDTTTGSAAAGIEVWIGYSDMDTDPSGTGWTWEVTTFNVEVGNNDEYALDMQDLGLAEGTYYYASRFSLNSGPFTYGGILADGSNGGVWDGATNISGVLTVEAPLPLAGDDCANPIVIGGLPYNTTDNTANYTNAFNNGDSSCNAFYLSGNDAVYTYTPTADASINFGLSGLDGTYSGIHVLDACPTDAGANCVGFAGNSTSADRSVDVSVVNGTTYYIVISTWAAPNSVAYTLDIAENTCTNATVAYSVVDDCANSGGFNIEVDITDMGTATDITVTDDQGSAAQTTMTATTLTFGPYVNATDVIITVADDNNTSCTQDSTALTQAVCPPANDTFAGATAIVPSPEGTGCAAFNFIDSIGGDGTTDSGLDGTCNGVDTGLDRFYTWTATTDALVWNDGAGNPGVVIRDAATEAEITCSGTFAADDFVLSGWTIGDDLVIQVYDYQAADVDTSFCLELLTLPTAPDCAEEPISPMNGATDIPVGAITLTWTAPSAGIVPTSYDLYAGTMSDGSDLALVDNYLTTTADDVTVNGFSTTIYWQIRPRNGVAEASGCPLWSFTTEDAPPPPANDLFADAIAIACGDSVSGTTISATLDESDAPEVATVEDDTDADIDSPWVWYSYDSSVSGAQVVTLSTCGVANTDYDTELFVYTGTSGALTLIDDGYDECGFAAENYAAETSFTSDGTTTYYIAVGGYDAGDVGNFQLTVSCETPCTADAGTLTADATPVELTGGTATISATPNGDIVVPTDYEVTYVLTSGATLVIEAAGATPSFDVTAVGDYTIHTLVAETSDDMDPNYLDLSVIVFGTTTGGDVLGIVTAGGLCASLDVTGAPITVEDLLGVDDENIMAFTYFPNPVKNTLTLNAQNTIENVTVFNMLGQEVLRTMPNTVDSDLDMSQLQTGTYFVKVTIANVTQTIRVIKQ